MRRFWVLLLVVLMVLTTAATAGAKIDCEVRPDHPLCPNHPGGDDGPMAGTECVDAANPDHLAYPVSDDFGLTIIGDEIAYVCIDVSDVEAGDWKVTVDVTGSMRELQFIVRDSVSPGDACAHTLYRKNTLPDSPFTFTLPVHAADYANACGTGYAEMVGDDYYATVEPDIQSPLVLQMFIRGIDSTTELNVDVDYPNVTLP